LSFEILNAAGHGGLAHSERRGGLGEVARFSHANEQAHCVDTVHLTPPCMSNANLGTINAFRECETAIHEI
jgi:hypothetical protein